MSAMETHDRPRGRRSFTDESKADAVAMVLARSSTSPTLCVGEGTLRNWVRLDRIERCECAELVELRKENARSRAERDLFKRATAFWVKESGQ